MSFSNVVFLCHGGRDPRSRAQRKGMSGTDLHQSEVGGIQNEGSDLPGISGELNPAADVQGPVKEEKGRGAIHFDTTSTLVVFARQRKSQNATPSPTRGDTPPTIMSFRTCEGKHVIREQSALTGRTRGKKGRALVLARSTASKSGGDAREEGSQSEWTRVKKRGETIADFNPEVVPSQIFLQQGDQVEITGEANGWYRGTNLTSNCKGVFPQDFVRVTQDMTSLEVASEQGLLVAKLILAELVPTSSLPQFTPSMLCATVHIRVKSKKGGVRKAQSSCRSLDWPSRGATPEECTASVSFFEKLTFAVPENTPLDTLMLTLSTPGSSDGSTGDIIVGQTRISPAMVRRNESGPALWTSLYLGQVVPGMGSRPVLAYAGQALLSVSYHTSLAALTTLGGSRIITDTLFLPHTSKFNINVEVGGVQGLSVGLMDKVAVTIAFGSYRISTPFVRQAKRGSVRWGTVLRKEVDMCSANLFAGHAVLIYVLVSTMLGAVSCAGWVSVDLSELNTFEESISFSLEGGQQPGGVVTLRGFFD